MHLTVFSMFQNDNFNETELVISKTLFTDIHSIIFSLATFNSPTVCRV